MDSITESIKNDLSEIQANNATVHEALLAALADNRQLKAELSAALAEIDRLRTLSHSAGSIMMRCTALAVQIEDTIGEYARMVQK